MNLLLRIGETVDSIAGITSIVAIGIQPTFQLESDVHGFAAIY
jgi:hypothetical protein